MFRINPVLSGFWRLLRLFGLCGLCSQLHALINYEISSVETQIFGTTTDVSSGSSANYDAGTAVGDFAVFNVTGVNPTGPNFNGQLRVTYTADNGGIGSDIMIARTSDSQGLTDTSTFTVLMDIGNGGGGGAQLTLDWFESGTYTGTTENFTPGTRRISQQINFTTFDIDFNQYVAVERAATASYTLDNSTVLSAIDDGTTISFEDSGANSSVTDPTTAAEYVTISASSYDFDMGKQASGGAALFMFEMRDPSDNVTITGTPTPVPEPRAFAVILGLAALFAVQRRRR